MDIHEHRSPARPADIGTPPGLGVAAAVATIATAAALPTSFRPVLGSTRDRVRPAVRLFPTTVAASRGLDRAPFRSKEDLR
jgi:hypothetical protein